MTQQAVMKPSVEQGAPVVFRLHPAAKGPELEQARVKAMLSRAQAAALFGVDVQRYTHAETRGTDEAQHAEWVGKLRAMHTGIEVPLDLAQSPATVRDMRIKAGLTKSEAASVVGLESGIGWHAYELGRYPMPQERWEAFLAELRSGDFRNHVTSSYRRGPKAGPSSFRPGRMSADSSKAARRAGIPDKQACGRFAKARVALRLSGSDMALAIGAKSSARVYNIESCRTSPTEAEVTVIADAMAARLRELEEGGLCLSSGRDIAGARQLLRMSQDEAGRCLFGESARPGASISMYEAGTSQPGAEKLETLSQFFESERAAQVAAIRELQTAAQD
jgi:hypothetical protein